MSSLLANLNYFMYSTLWLIVRKLPKHSAYKMFDLIATIAYRRNRKRVQYLRKNYQHVFPTDSQDAINEKVQEGLRNAMRYWCDTFRISDWDSEEVSKSVETKREELLLDSFASGNGVIVALPHAGNWDHAGLYFCSKGIQVNTVAEHLKPERLFRKFLKHRESMGMSVLDLNAQVITELESRLKKGALVALVADRDLSKSGVTVNFFNGKARMPAGPALLAYRTNAVLITAFVSYTKKGIQIDFSGPFKVEKQESESSEVTRLTQQLALQFEKDISRAATSWHMQQRIFIDEDFQVRS
jgi:lauroyl/myristoyl acyltransferase